MIGFIVKNSCKGYACSLFLALGFLQLANYAHAQDLTTSQRMAEQGKADGTGVARDPQQAVAWYRKVAEQGNSDGQFLLGDSYSTGTGVARDPQQAVFWFRKAAEQGHADAQVLLGKRYATGEGVAQDNKQAVAWYRKAAEQGNTDAHRAEERRVGKASRSSWTP